MKGVIKASTFWPLFLVAALVGGGIIVDLLPLRAGIELVRSVPVAPKADSSFLAALPVAIASGLPAQSTSSLPDDAVSGGKSSFLVNATAIFGGSGPFHRPKPAKAAK